MNKSGYVEKNGMPAIPHPLPKIVKKFNTIAFTGGTGSDLDANQQVNI